MKKLLFLFSIALLCILNAPFLTAAPTKAWFEEKDIPVDKPFYQEPEDLRKGGFWEEEIEDFEEEPTSDDRQQVIDPSKAGMFEEKDFISRDPSKAGFFEEGEFDFDDNDDEDDGWYMID
jgi:hypothetical protein